jgi:hypothetical protein
MDLRLGDIIIVPEPHNEGTPIGWNEDMEEWVGEEMTISEVLEYAGCPYVRVQENSFWWDVDWTEGVDNTYEDEEI